MIKNFFILLLLAVTVTASRAQTPDTVWHLVNDNLPTGVSRMQWTNDDTGFFLGSGLALFRTTNAGMSIVPDTLPNPVDTLHLDTGGVAFTHYSRARAIENIYGMTWPSATNGFVVGETYPDKFAATARPIVLRTNDGGTSWQSSYPKDTLMNFTSVYFPREKVGFASASEADSSLIVMSTDSGKTWSMVAHSSDLTFNNLHFIDAKNGIVFGQSISDGSNHILYTTDQWATSHDVALPAGSLLTFLRWNANNSWLVAIDSSIYQSVDSGKHWVTVLPADTMGSIVTTAFRDSIGFAFRSALADTLPNVVHSTRNYGVTWMRDTIPTITFGFPVPISASMPSDSVAFLMAQDGSNLALLRINHHSQTSSGGGEIVSMSPSQSNGLSAAANGNEIIFSAEMAPQARTIQIMDILGRVCASVSLPSGATNGTLPMNELRAGGYFARLGNQVVKFTVWN